MTVVNIALYRVVKKGIDSIMTSRRLIIRMLRTAAKQRGLTFVHVRQGANHEIFQLGDLMIPIPRHNEIDNDLAAIIFKEAETTLGKGWYR